jgi:hypothetical protein
LDVQSRGLKAIELLWGIFQLDKEQCTPEEYERIRRGVGISVARIQMDVLDTLYKDHPDLNQAGNLI